MLSKLTYTTSLEGALIVTCDDTCCMDLSSHMKGAPLPHEAVFTKPVPTGNMEKAKDTKGT